MADIYGGDFLVVLCHPGEETAVAAHLVAALGSAVGWNIISDPAMPSGKCFNFNQSHVQREVWGHAYDLREVRRGGPKAAQFSARFWRR